MTNIPFSSQKLPSDQLTFVQMSILAGREVAGEDLLRAVEQSGQQPLSVSARDIIRRASIPAVKIRGRPSKIGAKMDFALEKLDQRYPALLRYEQRRRCRLRRSGKATLKGESPSLLAYERLLRHMKNEFGAITREGLMNKHCQWKSGRFHCVENDVNSNDYEEEINRLFPPSPES